MTVTYLDQQTVERVYTKDPGGRANKTGYGKRIPSRFMIKLKGRSRPFRVYVACFSNAGTPYIQIGGEDRVIGWNLEETPREGKEYTIKAFNESEYLTTRRPYYHTGAERGRKPDTLFILVMKTPSGLYAKHQPFYSFNGLYKTPTIEQVRDRLRYLASTLCYKGGKTIYEIVQYSGDTNFAGQTVSLEQ